MTENPTIRGIRIRFLKLMRLEIGDSRNLQSLISNLPSP